MCFASPRISGLAKHNIKHMTGIQICKLKLHGALSNYLFLKTMLESIGFDLRYWPIFGVRLVYNKDNAAACSTNFAWA